MAISKPVRITFRDSAEFEHEFDQNLSSHGIFLPTATNLQVRDVVDFVVVVPGSGVEIPGRGEVAYVVDEETGKTRSAGLQILQFDMQAARRARASGEAVDEQMLKDAGLDRLDRRRWPRIPTRLRVRYRTVDGLREGIARDISTGGLYLCVQEPLEVGASVMLALTYPEAGREMALGGEVARPPLLIDRGVLSIGLGIRFRYLSDESRLDMIRLVECLSRSIESLKEEEESALAQELASI